MSDLFRVRIPREIVGLGPAGLAILAHLAEDTGNDILLLQVSGEVERQAETDRGIKEKYQRCYMAHWDVMMSRRAKVEKKGEAS